MPITNGNRGDLAPRHLATQPDDNSTWLGIHPTDDVLFRRASTTIRGKAE